VSLSYVKIGLVFSIPYCIEKNALESMHSSLPPPFGLVRLADRMNKQSKFFDVPLVLWCSEGLLLAVAWIRGRVGGWWVF